MRQKLDLYERATALVGQQLGPRTRLTGFTTTQIRVTCTDCHYSLWRPLKMLHDAAMEAPIQCGCKWTRSREAAAESLLYSPPVMPTEAIKAFIGKTVGKLTVLQVLGTISKAMYFEVECTCGRVYPVQAARVMTDGPSAVRSCGICVMEGVSVEPPVF